MDISAGTITEKRTVATNREGTRAARILQVMITDVKDVQSVQLIAQTGEESNPPAGSIAVVIGEAEGMKMGVATADGILPDLAVGGKRIYSTNAPGDTRMADIRLDPDGKITATGPVAIMTMLPNGQISLVNANGSITISPEGLISFHGTAAHFDCPVTAPEYHGSTDGGGSGEIMCKKVTATEDVLSNGTSGHSHVHTDPQGGNTGVPV